MVSVKLVYDILNIITNKETTGNTLTVDEYNTLIKAVNIDMLNMKYGIPSEYRPGYPLPKMTYEITKKLMDDLSFLKVRTGIDVSPLSINNKGEAAIPKDYLHLSSAGSIMVKNNDCDNPEITYTEIELLTDAQIYDRLSNSITKPTFENPCMAIFNNYFQFYPKTLRNVELTYLRYPKTPYLSYIVDSETDEIIFDDINTINFEFPNDCLIDIVKLVTSYVGINLVRSEVIQYVEQIKE